MTKELQQEYLVTARKWRPLQFKDVVGQEHVTKTLDNAIKSGRIHHAYLFSGPRGVGKTTTARIYARAINCTNPQGSEPCNECESCEAILSGRSLDVIEIDGASNNSVDDIRKLRENAKYPPITGKYKMYIIDEVHMLSTSAFNALLKTLEEPPPHLLFVFATTEAHKMLPTILSRCQRFDFRRMENESIINHLKYISDKEQIKIDEESLIAIAKKADGSMRDSQSIFDQVVAFCGTDVKYEDLANALHLIDQEFFFRISTSIINKDLKDIFTLTNEIMTRGYDIQECLSGLLEHFRHILTVKVTGNSDLIIGSESMKKRFIEESEKFSKADLLRFMNLTAQTEQALRFAPQPRIRLELVLVQMASMDSAIEISLLLKELKGLKKKALTADSGAETVPKGTGTKSIVEKIKADIDNQQGKPAEKESPKEKPAIKKIPKSINSIVDTESDKREDFTSNGSPDPALIEEGWEDFKKAYAVSKYGLYVLSQKDMVIPKFFKGEIVLQCKTDFISENIKKKIIELREYLTQFYKAPVTVKVLIADEHMIIESSSDLPKPDSQNPKNNKEIQSNSSITNTKQEIPMGELTPIEEALVEMFGAKQIKVIKD